MIPTVAADGAAGRGLYAKVKFASYGQQTAAKALIATAVAGEDRRVALATQVAASEALRPDVASGRRRLPLAWLGTLPFFAYTLLFLFLPAGEVLVGAFKSVHGGWTLSNVTRPLPPAVPARHYKTSIEVSLHHRAARRHRSGSRSPTRRSARARRAGSAPALTTFSGVAANFGGIPLAFAFIATLGTIGIATQFLKNQLHIDIYATRLHAVLDRPASRSSTSTSRSR